MKAKTSVYVIGAGPAGLAAARELVAKPDIKLYVIEKDDNVGGISRTEAYKGYFFDIGGHRFFTKNTAIETLWRTTLGPDFLPVQRRSRIYYNRRFFHYPSRFWNTVVNLGVLESVLVLASYLRAVLFPSPLENTFEEWTINRFGKRLYQLFFKSYTEKVWGISCDRILSDWAAQRIKGLSFTSAAANAIFKNTKAKSLIEEFFYPRLGPGMMWERFREHITGAGGSVELACRVVSLHHVRGIISEITYQKENEQLRVACDEVISSLPLDNLIGALDPPPPDRILKTARKISYRAFIIVVLILDKKEVFPDQWLYIHAPEVAVGRIQNFKNWSSAMVPDGQTTSLGMEYFCSEQDRLWRMTDADFVKMATRELAILGIAEEASVLDSVVIRQPKAYPVYDDGYKAHIQELKNYLSQFENLQTVGRNGMHRYNNMDHSMLTGIMAAENVLGSAHNIWATEDADTYLEEGPANTKASRLTKYLRPLRQKGTIFSTVAIILLFVYLWSSALR